MIELVGRHRRPVASGDPGTGGDQWCDGLWHLDGTLASAEDIGPDLYLAQGTKPSFVDAKFGKGWMKGAGKTLKVDDFPGIPCQGVGNWTLDFWLTIPSFSPNQEIVSTRLGEDFTGWILLTGSSGNTLKFLSDRNGTGGWQVGSVDMACPVGVPVHVGICRAGDKMLVYINGVRTMRGYISASDFINYGGQGVAFGSQNMTWTRQLVVGATFDEIRLSNIARYYDVSSFTVPAAPY